MSRSSSIPSILPRIKRFTATLLLAALAAGISACDQRQPFDSQVWARPYSFDTSQRAAMLDDLLARHSLIGLSRDETLALLGPPDRYVDPQRHELEYRVDMDFDTIDPVYTKSLRITLDETDTVAHWRIVEWRKR